MSSLPPHIRSDISRGSLSLERNMLNQELVAVRECRSRYIDMGYRAKDYLDQTGKLLPDSLIVGVTYIATG